MYLKLVEIVLKNVLYFYISMELFFTVFTLMTDQTTSQIKMLQVSSFHSLSIDI